MQLAVYKTASAEYLDAAYKSPETMGEALERLAGTAPLVDRARELEVLEVPGQLGLPQGSAADLANFINEKGPETLEQVVRYGFRQAMQFARDKEQPIEAFWVPAPGDDFELHICEGRDSIVVLFLVPGAEKRDYGSTRAKSRSWVVRAGDRADVRPDAPRTALGGSIVQIQVSGPYGSLS
jgi:hypothetical protein